MSASLEHTRPQRALAADDGASPRSNVDLGLSLSAAELKQLTSFLDGAIMDSEVRHHLWKSWGLCERHGWAYAAVEIERGGGRPFSTTILMDDLMTRVVRTLKRTRRLPWPVAVRRLRPSATCFTCEYVEISRRVAGGNTQLPVIAGSRADTFPRTMVLLADTQSVWSPLVCPICGPGQGPICRIHLLAGTVPGSREVWEEYLAAIALRLRRFLKSMTWRGPTVGELERIAWVEALGWFYGWAFPLELVPPS